MTQFAITIWAWELTGEATALALVWFFTFAPSVLLSPFAGTLVDRWNRKAMMMASDLAAGVATGSLLLLMAADRLEIWHLYVAGALWMVGGFMAGFFIPIVNGSSQAIWQSKVPPAIQGRVFSVRRLIAAIAAPVAMLLPGPAADNVFEPLFMTEATAPPIAASLVGTGPGAGMAFMLLLAGIAGAAVAFGGYLVRPIRDAESILPDHAAGD
jgi:MFS family permease